MPALKPSPRALLLPLQHHSARVRPTGARQKGYTLMEMAIVALFLALLSIFSIQQVSSRVGDVTKAEAVYTNTRKLGEFWSMVWQFCGLPPSSIDSVSVGNGTGTAAVNNLSLASGRLSVNTVFGGCYKNTGMRPMTAILPGQSGAEAYLGFPISWGYASVNGRHAVMVNYAKVSDDVLLPLYRKYSKTTGATTTYSIPITTSNTTDDAIRFTTATTSGRTVTVIHVM